VIRTGATGAGSTALAARGALTESSRADAGRVLIFLTWRGILDKPRQQNAAVHTGPPHPGRSARPGRRARS
jgi:hypothetical protein